MEDASQYGSGSALPATAVPAASRRSRGRWLIVSALVLPLLLYIASPYYAFWRFTTALRARDAAALEQRVDFQALRKSMKQQLNARIAELRPRNPKRQKVFDALSNAFGSSALDSIVDQYLTPEGLAAFLASPKAASDIAAGRVPQLADAPTAGPGADAVPDRRGARSARPGHRLVEGTLRILHRAAGFSDRCRRNEAALPLAWIAVAVARCRV